VNEDVAEAKYFIDSETLAARLIAGQLAERGATAADSCIAWIVKGGLGGDPKAVTIMRHAYLRYLAGHKDLGDVVDWYLGFYVILSRLLRRGGIKL